MGLFDKLLGHPPKPDKFARMFMDAMKAAGDTRTLRFDPQEFRILFETDADTAKTARDYVNLRNFYDEYCRLPDADRKEYLQRSARVALLTLEEVPDDFETARPNLRPKIWLRSMIEQLGLQRRINGESPGDPPTQMIGDHLLLGLVYDLPDAVRSVTQDELEKWGVSFYEAMEIATENLQAANFVISAIGEQLYASLTCDTYDASRLVLRDLIRRFSLKGDPIAMIPNRDNLLVAGSEDEEGLGMMLDLAEKALAEEPRPLLSMPLRLSDDEWLDWMPSTVHVHYPRFKLLALKWFAEVYAEQKNLLEAIYQKTGEDIFVASYSAVRSDQGELSTFCVWSDTVDSLLPRTDKVFFVREGKDILAEGSWERVQEVAGDLMLPTEEYPARFRVKDFPDAQQLTAIGPPKN